MSAGLPIQKDIRQATAFPHGCLMVFPTESLSMIGKSKIVPVAPWYSILNLTNDIH